MKEMMDEGDKTEQKVDASKRMKTAKVVVPPEYLCPITHEIMKDPVCTSDGHVYDKTGIELWLKDKNTSPMTNEVLPNKTLVPNLEIKAKIEQFLQCNNVSSEKHFVRMMKEGTEDELWNMVILESYLEITTEKNEPLLIDAVKNSRLSIVKYLAAMGANVNVKDNEWEGTPLYWASGDGKEEIARSLIESGANIHAVDKNGSTPLYSACYWGRTSLVDLLLKHSSKINQQNRDGYTPLHAASQQGHLDIVKMLLEHGADTKLKSNHGQTALHLAAYRGNSQKEKSGHTDIVQKLIESGIGLEEKTINGETALHLAAQKAHHSVIELLIKHGADVKATNNASKTPFDVAFDAGKHATAELLRTQTPVRVQKLETKIDEMTQTVTTLQNTVTTQANVITTLQNTIQALELRLQSLEKDRK